MTTEARAEAGSVPQAGRAMMKGTVPLLERILGWGGALGKEGQHISSHLTRVISTANEVSAHRVLKAEAGPRGLPGKVEVKQGLPGRMGPRSGNWAVQAEQTACTNIAGCPRTECLSVTPGAAKGLWELAVGMEEGMGKEVVGAMGRPTRCCREGSPVTSLGDREPLEGFAEH